MTTSLVLLFASLQALLCSMHPLSGSQKLEGNFFRSTVYMYSFLNVFSVPKKMRCAALHLINAIIYSRLSRLLTIECTRCNKYICLIFVLSSLWWTQKNYIRLYSLCYSGLLALSFSPLSSSGKTQNTE